MPEKLIIPQLHGGTVPSLKQNNYSFCHHPFSVRVQETYRFDSFHWHDYTQLWYTVSGSYDQIINGERITQRAGSLALIFPFTRHTIDTTMSDLENTRIICISVFEDLFSKNIMPFRPLSYVVSVFDKLILTPSIRLSGKEKERMDTLFEDCLSGYQLHDNMDEKKIFAYISDIFELLAKSSTKISDAKLLRAHERSLVISEATKFISSNSTKNISLDEISKLCLMSKRSFNDKFKACTGQNFYDFYMYSRLKHVIWHLRFTDMPISDIAEMCGFYDSVHLSHTIKNMFGISPAELRAQMRAHSQTYGEYVHAKRMERIGWMNLAPEVIETMHRGSIGLAVK